MKITFATSLLQRIINLDKVEPIEFAHLSQEEFTEVVEEINEGLPECRQWPVSTNYVPYENMIFYNEGYSS